MDFYRSILVCIERVRVFFLVFLRFFDFSLDNDYNFSYHSKLGCIYEFKHLTKELVEIEI